MSLAHVLQSHSISRLMINLLENKTFVHVLSGSRRKYRCIFHMKVQKAHLLKPNPNLGEAIPVPSQVQLKPSNNCVRDNHHPGLVHVRISQLSLQTSLHATCTCTV